jgi:hypothetical protein
MDSRAGGNAFATGNALMQGYAQAGKDVLSGAPNSHTAERLMVMRGLGALTGGGMGYGAYEAEQHGHTGLAVPLALGAAAAGAYSKTGTKLMQNALLSRTAGDRIVGKQLNALAPKLGLPVAAGTLALQSSTVDR